MGFETVVSGYIAVEDDASQARRAIESLPSIEADEWPFLPREIFNLAARNPMIAYKGRTLFAFAMCVKEINHEWGEWLPKFERLLEECGADGAQARLEIPYWASEQWQGHFTFSWRRKSDGTLRFEGEPRQF